MKHSVRDANINTEGRAAQRGYNKDFEQTIQEKLDQKIDEIRTSLMDSIENLQERVQLTNDQYMN